MTQEENTEFHHLYINSIACKVRFSLKEPRLALLGINFVDLHIGEMDTSGWCYSLFSVTFNLAYAFRFTFLPTTLLSLTMMRTVKIIHCSQDKFISHKPEIFYESVPYLLSF